MHSFLLEYIAVKILGPYFNFTYICIFVNRTNLFWRKLSLSVGLLIAFIKFDLLSIKPLFVNLSFKAVPEKFNIQFFNFQCNEFITSVFLRLFNLVYYS